MDLSLEQLNDFVGCVVRKLRPDVQIFGKLKIDDKDENVLILPVRQEKNMVGVRLNRNTMSQGAMKILDELEVELGKAFGYCDRAKRFGSQDLIRS